LFQMIDSNSGFNPFRRCQKHAIGIMLKVHLNCWPTFKSLWGISNGRCWLKPFSTGRIDDQNIVRWMESTLNRPDSLRYTWCCTPESKADSKTWLELWKTARSMSSVLDDTECVL
jgi:hypothetical protein